MISPKYKAQVDLLLQVLPHVAKEEVFALKGGSAINLFVREMPRLSVDIDLTYLPFDDRRQAFSNISSALARIKERLEKSISGISVTPVPHPEGKDVKLNCQLKKAQIKIEVNTTTRGHIYPVRMLQLVENVQNEFGKFAASNVVSHSELFGGKICAALDRQHPRDLFDVYLLFKNEGYSEEIKIGFMVSLLSHMRSMSEILKPNFLDQKLAFERQFAGMASIPFTYNDFEKTRDQLIQVIHSHLNENDKAFFLSFKKGNPDWDLFPVEQLRNMPAIKWKLENITKLSIKNSSKHMVLVKNLESILHNL